MSAPPPGWTRVTQQNAAMVQEANAASRTLSEETDGLADLVVRFQTKTASAQTRGGPSGCRER